METQSRSLVRSPEKARKGGGLALNDHPPSATCKGRKEAGPSTGEGPARSGRRLLPAARGGEFLGIAERKGQKTGKRQNKNAAAWDSRRPGWGGGAVSGATCTGKSPPHWPSTPAAMGARLRETSTAVVPRRRPREVQADPGRLLPSGSCRKAGNGRRGEACKGVGKGAGGRASDHRRTLGAWHLRAALGQVQDGKEVGCCSIPWDGGPWVASKRAPSTATSPFPSSWSSKVARSGCGNCEVAVK